VILNVYFDKLYFLYQFMIKRMNVSDNKDTFIQFS